MSEYERNREAAQQICRDLRWDGWDFNLGDHVALLDGKVIAVADDPADVLRTLRSINPDPSRGMVLEVAPPVTDVIR